MHIHSTPCTTYIHHRDQLYFLPLFIEAFSNMNIWKYESSCLLKKKITKRELEIHLPFDHLRPTQNCCNRSKNGEQYRSNVFTFLPSVILNKKSRNEVRSFWLVFQNCKITKYVNWFGNFKPEIIWTFCNGSNYMHNANKIEHYTVIYLSN